MKFIRCNSRKHNTTTLVKVSDEDYEKANSYSWYIDSQGYAVHSLPGGRKLLLHRFIMEPDNDLVVDHIDGNPLNNCRENLRICTAEQNSRNRKKQEGTQSQYKGVCRSGNSRWRAFINGEYLGTFATEFEAAQAYDRKAIAMNGPHARTNFPASVYMSSIYSHEQYMAAKEEAMIETLTKEAM